jgi:hypothetical protein
MNNGTMIKTCLGMFDDCTLKLYDNVSHIGWVKKMMLGEDMYYMVTINNNTILTQSLNEVSKFTNKCKINNLTYEHLTTSKSNDYYLI